MADNARLHNTTSPAGGSAVGRDLREAREALGISIAQLADTLRIRAAHIEAMEEGRFADLPGRPYTFGFARSIARHLGLDPDAVAARLRDEVTGTSSPGELVFPESTEDKRLSRTGWVLISLVAASLAYGGWVVVSKRGEDRPAEFSASSPSSQQVPEVVVEAPPSEPSAPAVTPSPDGAAQDMQPTAPSAPGAPAATPPAATPAPRAEAPRSAPTAATTTPSTPSVAATAPQADAEDDPDATPEPEATVATAEAPAAHVVIRARQDSWVQIEASNGNRVFARTLRAGETYAVPEQPGLRLTTGNAGAIDVVVDGQPTPPLGQLGMVRRNISLDANRLKAGKALE